MGWIHMTHRPVGHPEINCFHQFSRSWRRNFFSVLFFPFQTNPNIASIWLNCIPICPNCIPMMPRDWWILSKYMCMYIYMYIHIHIVYSCVYIYIYIHYITWHIPLHIPLHTKSGKKVGFEGEYHIHISHEISSCPSPIAWAPGQAAKALLCTSASRA